MKDLLYVCMCVVCECVQSVDEGGGGIDGERERDRNMRVTLLFIMNNR